MDYINLISAAGIGGIIGSSLTAVVQAYLSNKQHLADRSFEEKKEAYIGFLEAMHESEINQTNKTALATGYWQNRCELVASKEI